MENLIYAALACGLAYIYYLLFFRPAKPFIDTDKIREVAFRKFPEYSIAVPPVLYDRASGTLFELVPKYYYIVASKKARFRLATGPTEACIYYTWYKPIKYLAAEDYTPEAKYEFDLMAMQEIWGDKAAVTPDNATFLDVPTHEVLTVAALLQDPFVKTTNEIRCEWKRD